MSLLLKRCLLFLSLCLISCSTYLERQNIDKILIIAEPEANLNTPVAVDMVFLYREDLIEKFLRMPAKTYFQKKQQLLLDYPQAIKVKNWEIIPGQEFEMEEDIAKENIAAIFVFADYLTLGHHRIRLPTTKNISILLSKETITFHPLEIAK